MIDIFCSAMNPRSKSFQLYAGLVLAAVFIVGSMLSSVLPAQAQEPDTAEPCAPDPSLSQAEQRTYRLSDEYKECLENRVAEREAVIRERAAQLRAQRSELGEAATARASATQMANERRAALSERAQERVRNLAANMSNRMEAAMARMDNIIGRLDSRIDKLSAAGIDTSLAAQDLANARLSLENAELMLFDIDALVVRVAGSDDPRRTWSGVKQVYIDTRDALAATHTSLRRSVALLKEALRQAGSRQGVSDAVRENDGRATSTPEDAGGDTE